MQFTEGAKVISADNEDVGTLRNIVIEPDTKEVTHLVVKKGIIFTEDKVVPISLVNSTTEEVVKLRQNGDDLEDLPDFEESHFVSADPKAGRDLSRVKRLFWYPPKGIWWNGGGITGMYMPPPYVTQKEKNIPEGTIALQEGTMVYANDGEDLGTIERVFVDTVQNRATHLLISKGTLSTEKKLIPSHWMSKVLIDEVYLSVDSDVVEDLPEYQL